MQKKTITTEDGSPSFYLEELNETYHSKKGAITESDYVYINKGLAHWSSQNKQMSPKIFEMGLGTGLNAYLSYIFVVDHKISCEYFAIEKYPLSFKEVKSLYMQDVLPDSEHKHFFDQLHL